MGFDTQLLRKSFFLINEREPRLARRFYETLFRMYPQTKSIFSKSDPAMLEEKVTGMFMAVADQIEQLPSLATQMHELGAKHVEYGITEEMYEWASDALFATLAKIAADEWTPELEAVWRQAYNALMHMMLRGADESVAKLKAARVAERTRKPA